MIRIPPLRPLPSHGHTEAPVRASLPLLVLCSLPSAALAQGDSLPRNDAPLCWRGKPAPACHSFWVTEISVEYPFATTATTYTFTEGTYSTRYSRRDVTAQLFWTVGPMFNTSSNRALGVTASAGFVGDGSRVAVEARRRYWTAERSAFDLSAGIVRMNVPYHPGSTVNDGYGLTAGAYAVGGDLVHVNGRADVVMSGNRVHAGASVGAGLGGYGAVSATVLLGALIAAVAFEFARNGDF